MSWRKFENHKEENREVKRFLISQGYANVKVGHGRGTAWGWMRVRFAIPRPSDCYCSGYDSRGVDWTKVREEEMGISCRNCGKEWQRVYSEVGKMVSDFTGRSGDYGGNINYDVEWLEDAPIPEVPPVIHPKPIEPEKDYVYGYGYLENVGLSEVD